MKRTILLLALLVAPIVAISGVAWAITNGTTDGNGHPNVGMLLELNQTNGKYYFDCSGTLISQQYFLTAAHCAPDPTTDPGNKVGLIFNSSVNVNSDDSLASGAPQYLGTFIGNPNYNNKQSNPQDIAVVKLDAPIPTTSVDSSKVSLPTLGQFNNVPKNQQFTAVGYGDTSGKAVCNPVCSRNYATSTLNTITASWLKLSQNTSQGNGGTCYGDSGGPNFLGKFPNEQTNSKGQKIISGITITGDSACKGTNVDYRLDTQSARSFLGQYVTLP